MDFVRVGRVGIPTPDQAGTWASGTFQLGSDFTVTNGTPCRLSATLEWAFLSDTSILPELPFKFFVLQ